MALNLPFKKLLQITLFCSMGFSSPPTIAGDLDNIKASGVLRHLGVPYANFVKQFPKDNTYIETGFDIELIQGFADHLGVDYQFVKGDGHNIIGQLIGQNIEYTDGQIVYLDNEKIQGDLIASGVTNLEWRKALFDFSDDYFPAGVWLFARVDSPMQPIQPSGSIVEDIKQVKAQLAGRDVLGQRQTCLDPDLYHLKSSGANVILPNPPLRSAFMIPAILAWEAESTLLDVVDGLAALEKWAGEIKVIGPISEEQRLAVAFRKNSPELRQAFNAYLKVIRADGRYLEMVKKYYPEVFNFYPDYFTIGNESDA
ncbi:transporter substrate-binding domain-containing protein [Psychromonas sp.]|uniref:transporter substrate-binding domain-containing protein n=1 Tax=Psychromonas sp. TaxID=1884585 RepID=UPI0035636A5A